MAINIKDIQSGLITLAGGILGDKIYNYDNGQPSVFKAASFAGKTPPSPKYLFVSIDVLPSLSPFQLPSSEGWISDTEYALQETRVLQFNIIVHGDGSTDINGLANELRMRLKMGNYINHMKSTFDAGYYQSTQIVDTSVRLTDQYVESAQFSISYTITDFTIDNLGTGIISQVEIDTEVNKDPEGEGGLYKGYDDPNPIPVKTELIPEA